MDKKTLGIVSYITLIGWIVALVMNKPKDEHVSFHVRQMLGVMIVGLIINVVFGLLNIGILSLVGMVIVVALWVIGLIGAIQGEKKLVPVIGQKAQDLFKSL